MTQTFGQQIKWDFKTNGFLEIKDKNGKTTYWENSSGYWIKREYNSRGNCIYREYSNGFWVKNEWDSQDNRIFYEDSDDKIEDNRPKPCEGKEIVIDGEKFKLVKV